MINGLYETHIFVEDLKRSIDFYKNKLELKLAHTLDERKIAFFWIGKDKEFMLGIWEKPKEKIEKRHFAFKTEANWILNNSVKYLKKRNINARNFNNDGTENPLVFCWIPAISIYFDDPDGHSLEFIGLLEGQSMPENGILTHEDWLKTKRNL